MFTIQQRTPNAPTWHNYFKESSERNAIQRADRLKLQHPNNLVRVVDADGKMIYQA